MTTIYNLEYLSHISPKDLETFRKYFQIDPNEFNIGVLADLLLENKLVSEKDIPYFDALATPEGIQVWNMSDSAIKVILKTRGFEPFTISEKATLFRIFVDSDPGFQEFLSETSLIPPPPIPKSLAVEVMSVPQTTPPVPSLVPSSLASVPTNVLPNPSIRQSSLPKTTRVYQLSGTGKAHSPMTSKTTTGNPSVLSTTRKETEPFIEETVVPTRTPMKFKDLSLTLTNTTIVPAENYKELQLSIDYQQFLDIYKSDVFLQDFRRSLIAFYREKRTFYTQKTKEILQEQRKSKDIYNEIQKLDRNITMDKIDPLYQALTIVRSEMSSIITQINARLDTEIPLVDLEKSITRCITDPDRGLDTLVGRYEIQDMLSGILYSFSKDYHSFSKMFNNFAIYGPSGVGKTKVGTVIGWVLSQSLILVRDFFKVVTRADLVGEYVGATAPRTRGVLLSSLEGVLFIDEAYQLAPLSIKGNDFGPEAITEIVNFLDKYIGANVVIVAGYEEDMVNRFMSSNEGLPRRFPNVLILNVYTDAELTNILIGFLTSRSNITIDQETANYLFTLITQIQSVEPSAFDKQAGDMLNLSGFLLRKIYSSFTIVWIPGNLSNNMTLIVQAFNEFLANKGLTSRLQIV